MNDLSVILQQQVVDASAHDIPLNIKGSGSKSFLGHISAAQSVDVNQHQGIVHYDPRELVLTARSGTSLHEIEAALAEQGQMLAFEPPHFGLSATLGGTLASALSGPRRPYTGSARDFVLGCQIINGRGEILRFGGQVMKNVAGYDVSRLMVGAYGTLGILLDISLKVLPSPAASITLTHECTASEAIKTMSDLLSKPHPIDGACFDGINCYLRISGSAQAVKEACSKLPGKTMSDADQFWIALREHQLPFFTQSGTLYRVVLKPATEPLPLKGNWFLDWGGAQRWLYSSEDTSLLRSIVEKEGGSISIFRTNDRTQELFQPLSPTLLALHQRIKSSFDPKNIFNRGRIYGNL